MGIDYNVYVGPFIECIPTKVMRTEEHPGCPKCNRETHGKFCSKCGTPIGILTKQVEDYLVDYGDCEQAFLDAGLEEDDLYTIDHDKPSVILVANSKGFGHSIDPKYEFGLLIDEEIDAVAEKTKLSEMYAKHIEILKSLYGEDNVSVRWGIISYTS